MLYPEDSQMRERAMLLTEFVMANARFKQGRITREIFDRFERAALRVFALEGVDAMQREFDRRWRDGLLAGEILSRTIATAVSGDARISRHKMINRLTTQGRGSERMRKLWAEFASVAHLFSASALTTRYWFESAQDVATLWPPWIQDELPFVQFLTYSEYFANEGVVYHSPAGRHSGGKRYARALLDPARLWRVPREIAKLLGQPTIVAAGSGIASLKIKPDLVLGQRNGAPMEKERRGHAGRVDLSRSNAPRRSGAKGATPPNRGDLGKDPG
jgi:hypothetical protein